MGDLLAPFMSYASFGNFCENLIENNDPAVALLTLEGIYRMERQVKSGQCIYTEGIKEFLRKWRNESPMEYLKRKKKILRNLTIFKALKVPMFIDKLGTKELMSSYEATEAITIDGNTPIFHVTHLVDAHTIMNEKRIKGSDNKNSIEGCWFGLDDPKQNDSVYGSRAFETTLSRLGVSGLRQGEIVSYKNEVNVILYAYKSEFDEMADLQVSKPTDDSVKSKNAYAYVKVSIFVPEEFLPKPDRFSEVISCPFDVTHGPFCVKKKRESQCPDEHHSE